MEVIGHMQIRFVTLLYLNMNVAANDLPHVKPPGCVLCCFCLCKVIYMSKKVIVPGSRVSQLLCYFVGFNKTVLCSVYLYSNVYNCPIFQ